MSREKEQLLGKCVAVQRVPNTVSIEQVCQQVTSKNVKILRSTKIEGAEVDQNLTRWILELQSAQEARGLIEDVQSITVQAGEQSFKIEFHEIVECEIGCWTEPHQADSRPRLPEKSYQQHQHQFDAHGQIPLASGFYHNIPDLGHMQHVGPQHAEEGGNVAPGPAPQQYPLQFPGQQMPYGFGYGPPPGQHYQPGVPPQRPLGMPQPHTSTEGEPHQGPQQFPQYPGGPQQMPQHFPVFMTDPQTGQPIMQDPKTGQWVLAPVPQGYPQNPQQQPDSHMQGGQGFQHPGPGLAWSPRGPPPAYNDQHGPPQSQGVPPMTSKAVSDQVDCMDKLQSKVKAEQDRDSPVHEMRDEANVETSPEKPGPDDEPVDTSDDEAEKQPTKILVTKIPAGVDEEYLEMFFENKRNFGGLSVAGVEFNEEQGSALIEFNNPNDVEAVINKCPVCINKVEVQVEVYRPPQPKHDLDDGAESLSSMVIVTGLPEDVDQEDIEMTFENQRKFKGVSIKKVDLDTENAVAIITYENESDVDTVLDKCPVRLMGKEVQVERYTLLTEEPEDETPAEEEVEYDGTQTMIIIYNVPDAVDEDYIQMFFENRRNFGGTDVANVELYTDHSVAIVRFDRTENVQKVLEKRPIAIKGVQVSVKVYETPAMNTVKVTGSTKIVSENSLETLEMYFENYKKSTGGPVDDIKFIEEENAVLVTFEKEDDAKRVAKREDHTLRKEKFNVELHDPFLASLTSAKQTKVEEETAQEKNDTDAEPEVEEGPSCTVRVRGMKHVSSRESVSWYFENKKRAGGGEIEKRLTDDEDDDIVYITYADANVAKSVADREEHTVDGKQLHVSLYTPPKPPPSYTDKVLLKGISPETTETTLGLFLEAKAHLNPVAESLTYHAEQEGVALITVESDIDFTKLEEVCRKYPLEGSHLKVSCVPISNCIQVTELSETVTKDTVQYYFENTRRSNGGPVEKVEMDGDMCLVYFTDYKTVDNVLEQKHTLGNQELQVRRYLSCIEKAEGDHEGRKVKIPEPIVIHNIDARKIKYITKSKTTHNAFKVQMEQSNSEIHWPSAEGDNAVSIVCTLTSDDKDARKLVKVWKEKANDDFEAFMKRVVAFDNAVVQDIWDPVMEKLKMLNIRNPDAVAVIVVKKDGTISVVGMSGPADEVSKQIAQIVKSTMEEHEKQQQRIKETVTNLKLIETRMLLADRFPTQMEKEFPELKIRINQNKNEIAFEGAMGDVQNAKIRMYEMKDKFTVKQMQVKKQNCKLFQSKVVKEYIVKKLKNASVVSAWEVNEMQSTLIIMSTEENIDQAVNCVQASVISNTVSLTKASGTVIQSEKWDSFKSELLEKHNGKLHFDTDELKVVTICSTDDIAKDVLDSFKEFMRKNSIYEEKLSFSKNIHKLLEQHHRGEISDIARSLQDHHVLIESLKGNEGFEIRGTADGIAQAKDQIESLVRKVKKKQHTLQKPGLGGYMQTQKGQDIISTIEKSSRVIISTDEDDSEEDTYADDAYTEETPQTGIQICASCTVYDVRKIFIGLGDMTDMKVDAIVNTADNKLSLAGGLGKAIVSKGGRMVQRSCESYIQSEGQLGEGEVFVGLAGNLSIKHIVHVVGPVWKSGHDKEEEKLEEVVFKALKQASVRSLKSMALPAISCGIYGYPVKRATSIIVKSVKNFFREVQESPIEEIYLCDMKEDTVKAFTDALCTEIGQKNVNIQPVNKPKPAPRRKPNFDPPPIPTMSTSDEEDEYQSSSRYATSRPDGFIRYNREFLLSLQDSSLTKPYPTEIDKFPEIVLKLQLNRLTSASQQSSSDVVRAGKISINILKEEIAKHKVDVIVNTTAKNLDLNNGAVSKTILTRAGKDIQQELKDNYPNGIGQGEIAITDGYKLKCKKVIHGSVMNWDGGGSAVQELKDLVTDCLTEAKKGRFSSIAFPAIGTGNLGYPKDVVAREMFKTVSEFANRNPQSSIDTVDIVLYPKDFATIKAFEAEQRQLLGGGGRSRQTGHYDRLRKTRRNDSDSDSGKNDDSDHLYEELPGATSDDSHLFGNVRIIVKQGDITAEDATCIVNSSNENLDLNRGAVSKALLNTCGPSLAEDAQKQKKRMKQEQVVVTKAPRLACKHIMHIVAKESGPEWKQMVAKCLQLAEENRYSSIAFPALGTGMKLSPGETANAMVSATLEFSKGSPKYVKDVRFVIFQKQMVHEFEKAVEKADQSKGGGIGSAIWKGFKGMVGFGGGSSGKTGGSGKVVQQAAFKSNPHQNRVTLIFWALELSTIKSAIVKLESTLDKEMREKVFEDSIIKKLEPRVLKEIKDRADKDNVEFQYTEGRIQVAGVIQKVEDVSDMIQKAMREADRMEEEKRGALIMKEQIQWYFIETTATEDLFKEYSPILNYRIEKAFKDNEDTYTFMHDSDKFVVDFKQLEEYNAKKRSDKIPVIRKDLIKEAISGEVPADWKIMKGNLLVFKLPATDKDYMDIEAKFKTSSKGGFVVHSIEKVQNKVLFLQYEAKKKQLETQNPPNTRNENFLWHGTAEDTVDSVNAHGFNRSYCGKNATAFGDGVYFAVNADYSCQDVYSRPGAGGYKKMYYCGVLTGEFTTGRSGMRVPPPKPSGGKHALYDSVTNNVSGPAMFIVFNDTQAYPFYIITFKRG